MGNWTEGFRAFLHPRVITMLFFGFSAGIPLLLLFSSLSLWLRQAGVERSAITFFSWAALAYSFKFVWAPIVDKLPLPYLTRRLGRRRAWILLSQVAVIMSILTMASIDPATGPIQLNMMALVCVMLGFSAATQDIVIDAYRIESASPKLQALMSSTYITGYRLAMLLAGYGSLYLVSITGSQLGAYNYHAWQIAYYCMAMAMVVGVITTLSVQEPQHNNTDQYQYPSTTYMRFFFVFILAVIGFVISFYFSADLTVIWKNHLTELFHNKTLANFCVEFIRLLLAAGVAILIAWALIKTRFIEPQIVINSYVEPALDFFKRYGAKLALLLLALICLYRISDIVLGVITQIFYQDIGYSLDEIATVGAFGVIMTIIGGLLGGILSIRYGIIKILFLGAILTVLTNLLFMLLAIKGYNMTMLFFVIFADNLSAGIATAAFIAFLSRLTTVSFTAVQYALFSSIMTLFPKIIGGYSGAIVNNIGYEYFFLFSSLLGLPVLGIIYLAHKHLKFEQFK